ncbi:MAG: hypothetical protein ACTHMV_09120 [Chitinophagaceae bacterium]
MIKQISGLIISLLISHFATAQSIVRFKISKPYAILSFIETASGTQSHSPTLKALIDSKIDRNDTLFNRLVQDFRNINLNYNYKRDEFPGNRRQYRSTYDLIVIAAVKSESLPQFRDNTIGILPNSAHQELLKSLTGIEIYYDSLIWLPSQQSLNKQIRNLRNYEAKANELFRLFSKFYHSSWTNDIPFHVTLYPIPGKRGSTTATPHANSLCVGVLTEGKDLAATMGVVVHEMCHVLYDEQVSGFQHQLDSAFMTSTSPYKNVAYNFFDEALATALGNGWAYEKISGTPDTSAWYNNEYINGFARAVYPLVKQYLETNKSIDPFFVKQAIDIFANTYPRSLSDYSILFNNMYLYADAGNGQERQELRNILGKYFQSSRYSFSSPVLHEYSIESLKTSKPVQLIIIDRDHQATLSGLKNIFPEIETTVKEHNDKNFVLSFYDQTKRPVILIYVNDKQAMDKAFQTLKEKKYMDAGNTYWSVD